jgi:outer membrane protein assembly factor BamB
MLMKFDSLGNELWIKYYSDQQEYDFGRMIIDKQGNLYIHQSKRYSKLNNFIVKLDPNGNVLWRSDTIQGGRSNSFPFINLMLKEEILSVVHDSRTPDNDNAAPIISQFETETGVLLFQSTIIEDANNPYEISEAPFVDNNWVLSCAKGVLNISPDASYQYTELGDSIPGILLAATEQSLLRIGQNKLNNLEILSNGLLFCIGTITTGI